MYFFNCSTVSETLTIRKCKLLNRYSVHSQIMCHARFLLYNLDWYLLCFIYLLLVKLTYVILFLNVSTINGELKMNIFHLFAKKPLPWTDLHKIWHWGHLPDIINCEIFSAIGKGVSVYTIVHYCMWFTWHIFTLKTVSAYIETEWWHHYGKCDRDCSYLWNIS